MRRKGIIYTGLIIAIIHFMLVTISVSIAFNGISHFDDPNYHPTGVERFSGPMAKVLMQPAASLWTPWMSKNMPNIVEWVFYVGNSLLWGGAISYLINVGAVLRKQE